jgi:CheY-like chemotaxis protein
VKQSSGYIWLYSEPGRGTTFKIYLPRVDEAAVEETAAVVEREQTEIKRGWETILLVEDDEMVRAYVLRVLIDQGYRILEAANGVEAIAIARRREEPIHLVLTDVVMPELGGRDAAATLVAEMAGLKVLYMSGYTNDVAVLQELLNAKVPFLQKPFSPEVLARTVRGVLDAAAISRAEA